MGDNLALDQAVKALLGNPQYDTHLVGCHEKRKCGLIWLLFHHRSFPQNIEQFSLA